MGSAAGMMASEVRGLRDHNTTKGKGIIIKRLCY